MSHPENKSSGSGSKRAVEVPTEIRGGCNPAPVENVVRPVVTPPPPPKKEG